MPSTYSSNLKIELQANGENAATWGDITNTNLGTALEQAIVGYGTANFLSDANLTLTFTNSNSAQTARALVLNLTSAVNLTTTRQLIVPTIQKQYIVQNNTLNGQSITVKTAAGSGVTIPNGRKMHVYVDGTNVIQMFDFQDTLTLSGALSLSGGTANGVAYLNASKVVTSGSALVFDGTNLGIGTASPGYKLDVSGTGRVTTEIRVKNSAGNVSYLTFEENGNGNSATFISGDARTTGNMGFWTNSTERMRLDTSGNLGLGVTPSAWSGRTAIQLPDNAYVVSSGPTVLFGANVYFNGVNRTYISNGVATDYRQINGEHRWEYAASGTAGNTISFTQAMTLDTSGNLGLGVTPSAWGTGTKATQVNYGALVSSASNNTLVTSNCYYNGTNWIYLANDYATVYTQTGGVHHWRTAISGTAGNTLTGPNALAQLMTLNASGNLGVGNTGPTARLDVQRDSFGVTGAFRAYDGTNNPRLIISGSADGTTLQHTFSSGAGNFMFAIGGAEGSGTEIARFNASGDFAIAQGNAPTRTLNIYRTGSTTTVMAAGNSNTGLDGTWFGVDGTGNGIVNVRGSYPLLFSTNALERARISASGIFGIQTAPSAWNNVGALQIGDNNSAGLAFVASDAAGDTGTFIGHGAYYDGSWRYTSTSVGAGWYQILGPNAGANHAWFAAPGGTAAAAITASTQIMTLTSAGFLGLGGVTSPSAILTLEGTSARTILHNRASSGAGQNLTVQAGGAASGATNTAGGTLVLASGIATGNGTSKIEFRIAGGGASGTADRTPVMIADITATQVRAYTGMVAYGYTAYGPYGSGKYILYAGQDASTAYVGLGVDSTNGSFHGAVLQGSRFLRFEFIDPTWGVGNYGELSQGVFELKNPLPNPSAYFRANNGTTTLSMGVDTIHECEIRTNQNKPIWFYTNSTQRGRITNDGDWVFGVSALSTSSTLGFVYVPTCAGVPTGTPTGYTGTAPMVIDTTNHRLYFYSGGAWRNAGP